MNEIEIVAAALGLMNVALVVRRSVWNYPFGIAMVTLYFFVFLEAKLYSDAILQIFFLGIQIYGWREWLRARGSEGGAVPVEWLSMGARIWWLVTTLVVSLSWGVMMMRFTDAAAPLVDATIAGMSVAAQILLALRKVENWVLWIAVNIMAIGLFFSRELYPTSVLYAAFLVMAVVGLVLWVRAGRYQQEDAEA